MDHDYIDELRYGKSRGEYLVFFPGASLDWWKHMWSFNGQKDQLLTLGVWFRFNRSYIKALCRLGVRRYYVQ